MTELEKKLTGKIKRQRKAMNELMYRCNVTLEAQKKMMMEAEAKATKLFWERQKLYDNRVVFTKEIDVAIRALEAVKAQKGREETK